MCHCGLPWSKENSYLRKSTIKHTHSIWCANLTQTQRPTNRIKLDSCTCDRLAQELCKNKKCATAGQCLEAGKCNEWTGRCDYDPKADGTPCDDFDPLTANDKCTAGVCKGEILCENVICPSRSCQFREEGDAVTGGNCNPTSGTCEYRFMQEDATCAFELQGATLDGKCKNNRCVSDSGGGEEDLCANVKCKTKRPCESSSGCDPKTGLCGYSTKSDGEQCTTDRNDQLERVCRNSQCVVKECKCREAVECEKSPGRCDPQTGMCFFERDKSCDERKLKEESEMCQGQISCLDDWKNCKKDTSKCISLTKSCTRAGAPCDKEYISSDGLTEQVVEIGVCLPNNAGELECVLNNNCDKDGQTCKNGNEAITDARCRDFECVGKDLCEGVVCQNRTQCFLPGLCNPKTGLCEYAPKPDNTDCDDNNPLTLRDTCQNGKCGENEDLCREGFECPPPDGCKKFICNRADGKCTPVNKIPGTFCNDNNERTFGDVCNIDGECVGQDPCKGFKCDEVCSDRSSCTDGICEECVPVRSNAAEPAQWIAKCRLHCKPDEKPEMEKEFCLTRFLAEPCQEQNLLFFEPDTKTCQATKHKEREATCIQRPGKETWSGYCDKGHVCKPLGDVLRRRWLCEDYGQCYETPECQSKKIDAKTLITKGIFSQEKIEEVGKQFDYNGDRLFDSYELNAIFVSLFLKKVEEEEEKKILAAQTQGDKVETQVNNNDGELPFLMKIIFEDFVMPFFLFLEKPTEQLRETFGKVDSSPEDGKISQTEYETLMAEVIARLTLECSLPKLLGPERACTPERRVPNVQGYFCRQGQCVPEYASDGSRGPLRFLRISNRDEYYKWLQTVVFPFYANASENNWKLSSDGNVTLLYEMTVRWVSRRMSCLTGQIDAHGCTHATCTHEFTNRTSLPVSINFTKFAALPPKVETSIHT